MGGGGEEAYLYTIECTKIEQITQRSCSEYEAKLGLKAAGDITIL